MAQAPFLAVTQDDVLSALRSFLLGALPNVGEVVVGQDNRVPEPSAGDFVVMTPILRERLETDVKVYADCAFSGSVQGNVITVAALQHGQIVPGAALFGTGVGGTGVFVTGTLGALGGSGAGGTGTYLLNQSLGTLGAQPFACGVFFAMVPTEITVQMDFHGPNSADYVQIASTLFRDDYGVQALKGFGTPPPGFGVFSPGITAPGGSGNTLPEIFTGVAPLYADDPKQAPYINDQNQIEWRWTLDVCVQANQIVTAPQQFAASITITPISVDTTYLP